MKYRNSIFIKEAAADNKGAALIVVLCFLVLVGLITSSAVVISQINAKSLKVNADRTYAAYIAEGAAARLQWLIMSDQTKFSDRNFHNFRTDQDDEQVRYLADGKTKNIKYYNTNTHVKVFDMASGIDISGSNPSRKLKSMAQMYDNDDEEKDEFEIFLDCLKDYTDRNDFIQLKGMEEDDYENLNIPNLPRNSKLEYREEILFIPNAKLFFKPDKFGRMSVFNVIPPKGLPKFNSKINFFSADKYIIMDKCKVDSEEAEEIIENRNNWLNSDKAFSDFFEPDTIGMLKRYFSFKESGFYTLIVKSSYDKVSPSRMLIVSLKISKAINTNGNQYYQYVLY